MFESIRNLPADGRYFLDPTEHPGQRVLELMSSRVISRNPEILTDAFPSANQLLQVAVQNWEDGKIVVELVSSHQFSQSDVEIRSISRHCDQTLHILIILDSNPVDNHRTLTMYRHWKVIAESVIRAAAQHQLGLSYHDSILAELLVVDHFDDIEVSIPEGVKRQLKMSSMERARFIREGNQTLLRYTLLGVDLEREWDLLPEHIRRFLLQRCDGWIGPLSNSEENWLHHRLVSQGSSGNVESHIARCKLGAALTTTILTYAHDLEADGYLESPPHADIEDHGDSVQFDDETPSTRFASLIKPVSSRILQKVNLCIKFLIISLIADPEYQRELDFVIQDKPGFVRWPLVFFLNTIWSYCKFWQNVLIPLVLFHRREHVARVQKHIKGMTTVLEKRKIVTESFSGPSTWFWTVRADGSLRVSQYQGRHDSEPSNIQKLMAVNMYTNKLILQQRDVYHKGVVSSSYQYDYENGDSRLPLQRQCLFGARQGEIVQYDRRGYITSGSAMRGDNRVTWKFWYRKNAKHEDELLWAEYTFPHITVKVLWSMPPRNPQKRLEEWIPFSTVTEATFIHSHDVYHASWGFEHKLHPELSVTLNGNPIPTPPMIKEDWFQVLQKPEKCSFQSENPLLPFSSIKTNPVSRLLGFNVRRYPIPTSVARTQLWKAWKDGHEVDAISARWLDEKLLHFQKCLSQSAISRQTGDAFPSANQLLHVAVQNWEDGKIVVELVSSHQFSQSDVEIRSISRHCDQTLHILIILDSNPVDNHRTLTMYRHWKVIAESVIRAAAQHQLGLSYHDSILAELLVVDHFDDIEVSIPEGVKRQLKMSSMERARFIREGNQTLLRYTLLGVDLEREWDLLPEHIRRFLLQRCDGWIGPLSNSEENWLHHRLVSQGSSGNVESHIARCKLGAALTTTILTYAHDLEADGYLESPPHADIEDHGDSVQFDDETPSTRFASLIKPVSSRILQKVNLCIKFLIISLIADPEYQRELDFVIQDKPGFVRWPLVFFLNTIWSYCKFWQNVLIPLVLFHRREHVARVQKHIKGMTTVLEKRKIVTESFSGPSTWFWTVRADGSLRVSQYQGRHDSEPSNIQKLMAVNMYTNKLILQQRDVYHKGVVSSSYQYDYENGDSRLPLQRQCLFGARQGEIVQYDRRGYITSGSAMRGDNRVTWKFWYRKNAKHEDELLWAEYTFPHITVKVLWSMPPRNPQKRLEEWIPFSTVTEATFIHSHDVYHASWGFEHKLHPELSVTLNGNPIPTPPMIKEDWFQVLQKPEKCSFQSENPLLPFSSIKTNPVSRLLGFNVRRYPIPTSVARTQLWKAWKDGHEVDAISARWLDEKLLRSDYIMRPYWRKRDFGRLEAAKKYLDAVSDSIMARCDLDSSISSWVHIAYKIADLYSFGPGGDARINTRKLESQLHDTPEELHVLAMDTSTWPNDPGGVSACRRDMVNDLKTIKWHVVAESANDYGVPRFQIERNVQSLTILPLWGLDFLNPTHGVLETNLDSAVVQRSQMTRTADITHNFLPILSSLVKCSRITDLNRQHIEEATRALVDLNTYFEKTRNWNDVWQHPVVKEKWRELWLTESLEGAFNISQWWDFEKPSLKQLDLALDLWCRYLFIFSLPVPEEIPDVFQASHHFTGATYGIVCKAKRNCTLHIWDHCISYREFTTFMSSAVSYDAPFVNSSLISLTHLSCVLLEHHADVVLPCCDYFNPGWEVELGTAEGVVEHRRTFERKIDPVVNGICNMEKFEPIKTIKTDQPTVVMLSHVQYAKDIKNAIMATDIIVNKWGIKDYRLHVYGDQERAATIATECQELIASKNLQDYCILKGLGNPSVVLQDAWLFLNSSISEGLPLAMGEAALTGVPVVCTDVGASYCVVTDRATGDRFSEVVPPNDSESLARAQISVMGLLGRWAEYADDPPGSEVPVLGYPMPTPEQVEQISKRIYAKTEQRRALGMRGRQNVLNNFSSERYLREHEQMLWVGKYRSQAHRSRMAITGSSTPYSQPSSHWVSRLTPESWISLSTENLARPGWRSLSSSTLSVHKLFAQKEKQMC
ncbi:glycosyl transferase, group 1 family protein, partial [Metarhizium majus ARSEF 297]